MQLPVPRSRVKYISRLMRRQSRIIFETESAAGVSPLRKNNGAVEAPKPTGAFRVSEEHGA